MALLLEVTATGDDCERMSDEQLAEALEALALVEKVTRHSVQSAIELAAEAAQRFLAAHPHHLDRRSGRGAPVVSPRHASRTASRPREHQPTGGRGSHSPPEDDPDPDLAVRPCACGCGAPARPDSKYATDLCGNRLRVHRHRRRIDEAERALLERCPALIHEDAVVAAIAGGMEPEDGLLWALFPAAMRARASVRVEAA